MAWGTEVESEAGLDDESDYASDPEDQDYTETDDHTDTVSDMDPLDTDEELHAFGDERVYTSDIGEEWKWHEDHNDPSADLVLVASDKVRFRVHSWYLRRFSGFIDDMFSVTHQEHQTTIRQPKPNDGLDPPVIESNARSVILRAYIDMVQVPNHGVPELQYRELWDLKDLCDRMQTSAFDRGLDAMMTKRAKKETGWATFLCAAQRSDIKHAKLAILKFNDALGSPLRVWPDVNEDQFEVLSREWFFELLRVYCSQLNKSKTKKVDQKGRQNNTDTLTPKDDGFWKQVSEEFFPRGVILRLACE